MPVCAASPLAVTSDAPTLTAALHALGYAHRETTADQDPARQRRVVTRDGADIYVGSWCEVWAWLTRTGQIEWAGGVPLSVREQLDRDATT